MIFFHCFFFISFIDEFFSSFNCFLLLQLKWELWYLYLNSKVFRNDVVFCWHFVILFDKFCDVFKNYEIKHWAYIICFFKFFIFFVLLSTCAFMLDVLFVCIWCIYAWSLFRFYCIDLYRVFLHNDRISWHFYTFFQCDYIRNNWRTKLFHIFAIILSRLFYFVFSRFFLWWFY